MSRCAGVRAIVVAVATMVFGPTAAWACSVRPHYVRPSNYELAQIADAVVIATPISEMRKEDDPFGSKVRVRVDQVLKGQVPAELDVEGMRLGRTRPSDPDSIVYSHPEGHAGPCNRVTLAKGAAYLLFLGKRGEVYAPLGYPFSRVSEDYAGEDTLWTRTVRTYLRLQTTETPTQQLATLEAMRTAILADPEATPADKALAEDIDQHLGSVSPWKPTAYLLAAYEDLKAGRKPRYRSRDPGLDGEQSGIDEAVGALLGDLDGGKTKPRKPRRLALEQRILNALLDGEHPTAMPLFETFARPGAPPDELAMAIRFMASNGRYRDAYDLVETRAVPMMDTADRDDFFTLAGAVSDAQEDPFHGDGHPRWQSDPEIAARWPKLALRITALGNKRFGEAPVYVETLKTLLGQDLRTTPELTFELSGHDNTITDWAAAELVSPATLQASRDHKGPDAADPLLLPLRIELHWHGLSNEPIDSLTAVFCLGPRQRLMLIEEWGRIGGEQSAQSMLRMAASPSMTAEDRAVLAAAIPPWDRRYKASYGESWLEADKAMQKLAKGKPIGPADITPLQPVICPAPK